MRTLLEECVLPKWALVMGWNANGRAFQRKVGKSLSGLAAFAPAGGFHVYAIKEPTRWVRDGEPRGDSVFYVGQTSNMLRRALRHLRDSGSAEASTPKQRRIYRLLTGGEIPVFEVLATFPTRLQALDGEQRWALDFVARGCSLYNDWPEHHVPPSYRFDDGTSVPTARLWDMTIPDAHGSSLKLAVVCNSCNLDVALPLAELQERFPGRRLFDLRKSVSCPRCGAGPCVRILRRKISERNG